MLAMQRPMAAPHSYGERLVQELEDLTADPPSLLRGSRAQMDREMMNPPNYSVDLEILSAETYPGSLLDIDEKQSRRNGRKRSGRAPLFGGLVLEDMEMQRAPESPQDAPAEDETSPPKKRQRRSRKDTEDEENAKKQRGRPRLDTQDETAADRRRTQIRLAQRAYRHRKETTIVTLKDQVSDMRKTIDSLDTVFRQYHDHIFNSGVISSNSLLQLDLQRTADQFENLVKSVAPQDSDHEGDLDVTKLREMDPSLPEEAVGNTEPQLGWGYSMSFEPLDTAEESSTSSAQSVEEIFPITDISNGSWPSADNVVQQYSVVQLPHPPIDVEQIRQEIERPLKINGPYTYSFQETTFARRLHRMCLEHGYRILNSPNVDPAYLNKRYKLTFCISNRTRMVQRFQELLKRNAGDALENWSLPFIRVGGAGTHFPRRDAQGNAIYPPNTITPENFFGPLNIGMSQETPRGVAESYNQMLESIGYGGEWFDSHDVEEYLKTKGLVLDGSSSFVDMDPMAISLPALSTADTRSISTSSNGSSPGAVEHGSLPEALSMLNWNSTDSLMTAYLDSLDSANLIPPEKGAGLPALQDKLSAYGSLSNALLAGPDFSDVSSTWHGPGGDKLRPETAFGASTSASASIDGQRKPVTIDVERLLQRLVENASTCLGRAPGFRKEQVDVALALSLQEAF